MQANRLQYWLLWQCSGTTRVASPMEHTQGFSQVPAPYHPGGRHGQRIWIKHTKHLNKTQLLDSNYGTFWSLVVCENFNPKTDPLLSSLMRWALCKCETPQLELESSAKFLAIKRCQRTKIGKVIKLSRSLIQNGCISEPIGVKLLSHTRSALFSFSSFLHLIMWLLIWERGMHRCSRAFSHNLRRTSFGWDFLS
jgi:hypothetical protein